MTRSKCRMCGEKAVWIDFFVAVGLAVFKTTLGFFTGSMALFAHGLYSFADFLTKTITLVSVRISAKPPTAKFPYGYGKIQFLSAGFVGLSLLLGAGAFLYSNVRHINEGLVEAPGMFALVAALVAAAVSEIMCRYLTCVAKNNNSPAIVAAAFDNRVDAVSSIAVVAGVGLANLGWLAGDHIAAILVSLLLAKVGFTTTATSLAGLMDVSVPPEVLNKARRIARQTEGVTKVVGLRGRKLGDTWELDIRLEVDGTLATARSHQIAVGLEQRIHSAILHTGDVRVSVIPSRA